MVSFMKVVRLGALLAAVLALSGMAGCPKSADIRSGAARSDGPPDRPEAGAMGRSMGGGMGMP